MPFFVEVRKVPNSLEEIVRLTKFTKSEIRLLYKSFKQAGERPSSVTTTMFFSLGMSQWRGDRTGISSDLLALLSARQLSKLHALSLSSVGPTETDVLYI